MRPRGGAPASKTGRDGFNSHHELDIMVYAATAVADVVPNALAITGWPCHLQDMTFFGIYATDLGSAHVGTFACPEQPWTVGRPSSLEPQNPTAGRKARSSR